MKKQFVLLAAVTLLAACGGNMQKKTAIDAAAQTTEAVDMHNAENALDIAGTYKGIFPAADCPGIEVTLTLTDNGTYTEHDKYLERDSELDERGDYTVEGNLLTVTPGDGSPAYYRVEENQLRRLDADKQPIPGEIGEHYVLVKTL